MSSSTFVKSLLYATLLTSTSMTSYAQRIAGHVTDAINGETLIGAALDLNDSAAQIVTDKVGAFQFENLDAGLYQITASYLGYKTYLAKDVWVKNGKTTFVNVQMQRDPLQLDEVVVNSPPNIQKASSIQITEEKINRYAASYNDPARLAMASPDAIVANDQNNQISVRGLSPALNVWRLEGVEIVNPNHLSNAGTFNDQPAATGGGVNILSAQMLDNSQFLVGQMDNTYGNGVAGIFDMNLRNGYAGRHQFTAQASFIGFDFSAEGPLAENSRASYIANYRYSFTGLLGLMGVDFGGEVIDFQDLSFNINIPLKNNASLKVFALGGLSDNDFKAKPFSESKIQKDRSDIHYAGKMGGMGTKFEMPLGENLRLSLTTAYSTSDENREQTDYDNTQTPWQTTNTSQQNSIWSNRANARWVLGKSTLDFGSVLNFYAFEYDSDFFGSNAQIRSNLSQLAPYANLALGFSENWSFTTGATYYHISRDEDQSDNIDYRASLGYGKNNTSASVNFGRYSQVQAPFRSFVSFQNNTNPAFYTFGMISSYRYIANVQQRINDVTVKLEGFYYDFPEITQPPTSNDPFNRFTFAAQTYGSSLNLSGASATIYYDLGATFFNSTFNDDENNPYNVKQSYTASMGKKWHFHKTEKERTLSVNIKGLYQGGLYQLNNFTTIKERLDDYARLDFRIQWIKSKVKSTTSWALDIQNITNRQNEAFQYFDSFTAQLETNYQLGFIPVLTYRVEF